MTAEASRFEGTVADAVMVPMLPCGDIDEVAVFWTDLGLEVTYRQLRPNPYLSLRAGGIDLHYYGMNPWDPEESHSTCTIAVRDTQPLHERFRAGLRARYGRVPISGIPRITRPRQRANNGGLSGFSLIDPAGNWIRITRVASEAILAGEGGSTSWTSHADNPVAKALENAVVIGDSHGDAAQARKLLSGAVRRAADPPIIDLARALAYLVELEARVGDADAAAATFARLEALPRDEVGVVRDAIAEARDALASIGSGRAG